MNKKILNNILVLSVLVILGFSSCDKDTTAGLTGITYYPDIVMEGEETIYLKLGDTYTDAGASATENGVEIEVEVSSNVDTSIPGSYSVGYTAFNSDGFSKTLYRAIIVYDGNMSTVDLSGEYSGHVIRNNDPAKEYTGNPVTLTPLEIEGVTGVYEISDWIAGFYAIGYGYGSNYVFPGIIQINGDNEVLHLDMSNPWGDPFDSVVGTYDPSTGVIKYDAYWLEGTYVFAVDLSK